MREGCDEGRLGWGRVVMRKGCEEGGLMREGKGGEGLW